MVDPFVIVLEAYGLEVSIGIYFHPSRVCTPVLKLSRRWEEVSRALTQQLRD
jgi:hypothetical protein